MWQIIVNTDDNFCAEAKTKTKTKTCFVYGSWAFARVSAINRLNQLVAVLQFIFYVISFHTALCKRPKECSEFKNTAQYVIQKILSKIVVGVKCHKNTKKF